MISSTHIRALEGVLEQQQALEEEKRSLIAKATIEAIKTSNKDDLLQIIGMHANIPEISTFLQSVYQEMIRQ